MLQTEGEVMAEGDRLVSVQMSRELVEKLGDWSPPVHIRVVRTDNLHRINVLEFYWAETGMPGQCDWGGCNAAAIAWRWDEIGAQWLPVCNSHMEVKQ